jgi:predicted lysophospholipase L1 biosynthesis ABC-type transport system permease subunit
MVCIELSAKNDRLSLAFTVGGIIRDVPASLNNARTNYFWKPTILIQAGAMEQIIRITGYDELYAYGDIAGMNGVFSDRQAAILASLNRAQLENNRQHTVSMRDASIRHISILTITALPLIAFAVVVLANGARSVYAAGRESNALLRTLGAEEEQVRGLYRRESLVVSGISAALSAGVLWFLWIGPEIGSYSHRWQDTVTVLKAFWEDNTAFIPGWVYGATLLALILLPIAAELLPLRREIV